MKNNQLSPKPSGAVPVKTKMGKIIAYSYHMFRDPNEDLLFQELDRLLENREEAVKALRIGISNLIKKNPKAISIFKNWENNLQRKEHTI